MKGLVYTGKIISLDHIATADRIVFATVVCGEGGKWRGIVRSADFFIDEKCTVYLPDAVIPENADMAFMKSTNWRVKMRRFRGAPSEVVITQCPSNAIVGDDLTEQKGVTKYSKPIPPNLQGELKDVFPSFIPKTDEPNWQRSEDIVAALQGHPYVVTEKCDGSSTTVYKWKGEFGVCSRNWELKETESNGYWKVANKYHLKDKLPEGFAIQFETCGPGIQNNPMGLSEIDGFAFSIFDIERQEYVNHNVFCTLCDLWKFPRARTIEEGTEFIYMDLTDISKINYANGKPGEGVVIRSQYHVPGFGRISFKAINLDYED